MLLLDARRLTGPNHLCRTPQVIVELAFDASEDRRAAIAVYVQELALMRAALGLSPVALPHVYEHAEGVVVGYDAPIDLMLACTEMSEWAALSAIELLGSRQGLPLEPKRTEIEAMIAHDRSPRLMAIATEARARDLPLLWDDEVVTVGTGARSRSWPRSSLPELDAIPWSELGAIRTALVTGTNGKTTSSRLLARVAREAGLRVGSSSSDEIMVGAEVIDHGDWTGPAAARVVLRRDDVDFAVLETARGGILRRGLAIEACDGALITNVSDDHVGSYGIDDLAAMTRVKAVVAQAVHPHGTVVLNAHDPRLVALADTLTSSVVFFADLDRDGDDVAARAVIARRRDAGSEVVLAEGGFVSYARGAESVRLVRVDAVPITFGGAARYNVENVLGVVALARALDVGDDAIVRGLTGFRTNDNPRRGELVERGGLRVLLDFGHNAEGVRAVLQLVASLRAAAPGRLTVVAGAAGDRKERDVEEVARAIVEAKPDRILLRDLRGYLRGRAPLEVPAMFHRALAAYGYAGVAATVDSEVDALRLVARDRSPGELVVVLVHLDHDEVRGFLNAL